MADSEKLTALKKAYADIILNTAKEAAARIMMSERKAERYQRELFAAKDEALRMLLRLKQMLDSKVSEAETASLSQQKKIEELEAQLGEAEDIVKDLRTELRELQDELEKVTHNQMRTSGEQYSEADIATNVTALEENRIIASRSIISSLATSQCDPVMTLEMKGSTLNETCDGNKCYSENGSHGDNYFVCNADFASIMMRSKEPELYRNGCTQRIRAFEGNLLSNSLSGQANGAKNQIFIREEAEDRFKCKQQTAMADNIFGAEKSLGEFKEMQQDGNCIQVHAVKSFRRKRKRATRYKKLKVPSFKIYTDYDVQSGEDSKIIESIAHKAPEALVAPKSPLIMKATMQSGSIEFSKSNAGFLRACTVQNTENDDELLIGEQELTGQEAGSAEGLEFSAGKTDLEVSSVLSVNSGPKDSDATEVLPATPMHNKFLKYTFQRKRKKEASSSPGGDSSIDNSTLQQMMGEQQSGSLESQKSSLTIGSFVDGQQLAQVARQLISLSEKEFM